MGRLAGAPASYRGEPASCGEFVERARADGYTDLLPDPEADSQLILCHPAHGTDGTQLELSGALACYDVCSDFHTGLRPSIPDRYPYKQGYEAVQNALRDGVAVPLEVLISYPDLLASYGP